MRTCLTEKERYCIEYALQAGQTPKQIAAALNRSKSCIYAEIKRGTVSFLDSELIPYDKYCADVAQAAHAAACRSRGAGLKIDSDIRLANYLENKIISCGYSPYAAMQAAVSSGFSVTFSLSTLYNYIRGGVFLKLCKKHLHKYKKQSKCRREQAKRKYARGVKSIEDRDKKINTRCEFGHWEMDTVVGRQGTTTCLLVLTERKTRFEIIRRMPNKSAECTQHELDVIERRLRGRFKSVFKTITTDNGGEFYGNGIVNASVYGGVRFEHFYCHPYCSNERGSNEIQNRFIRRFVKKSTDIASVSKKRVKEIQDYINNYPRALFSGLSSAQMLANETGFV